MAEVLTNSFLTGESMAGLKAGAPTPQALTVHEASRVLEVGFSDGATFRIPFELMRVYSPSAEVQGHGPGQEVLQTGKRDVVLVGLEPVGNYASSRCSRTATKVASSPGITFTNWASSRMRCGRSTPRAWPLPALTAIRPWRPRAPQAAMAAAATEAAGGECLRRCAPSV